MQLRDEAMFAHRNRELGALANGLATMGPQGLTQQVQLVVSQLQRYSGRSFPVQAAQNFTNGLALPDGRILLDVSSAAQSMPVLAYRLAHEWGHQVLGHGSPFFRRSSPTAAEDQADVYAGRFVCSQGYDIDEVADELLQYPDLTGIGDEHSGGATRAALVRRGCDAVTEAHTQPGEQSTSPLEPDERFGGFATTNEPGRFDERIEARTISSPQTTLTAPAALPAPVPSLSDAAEQREMRRRARHERQEREDRRIDCSMEAATSRRRCREQCDEITLPSFVEPCLRACANTYDESDCE